MNKYDYYKNDLLELLNELESKVKLGINDFPEETVDLEECLYNVHMSIGTLDKS